MVSNDNSDHLDRNLTRPNSNRPMRRVERYRTLNELDTNQNRIERDIRHQTWRQLRNAHAENDGLRSLTESSSHHTPLVEQRGKGRKRDNSHLVETNQNRIERDIRHQTSVTERWRQSRNAHGENDGLRSLTESSRRKSRNAHGENDGIRSLTESSRRKSRNAHGENDGLRSLTESSRRQSRNAHGENDGLRSLTESSNHHTPLVEQRGKGRKRDNSHLVEKAPETEVKKPDTEGGGSFFDCNICLELAKEPVLTCCGHLFCWPCFYQVSNVDSSSKECPVCKGEVSDSTVTPIYGNGDSKGIRVTESGLLIPSRPKGRRVERVRQQQSLLSHAPISDALRQTLIRNIPIGDGQASQQTGESHSARLHWALRVFYESPLFSSIFSNTERLFVVGSDSPTAPTSS